DERGSAWGKADRRHHIIMPCQGAECSPCLHMPEADSAAAHSHPLSYATRAAPGTPSSYVTSSYRTAALPLSSSTETTPTFRPLNWVRCHGAVPRSRSTVTRAAQCRMCGMVKDSRWAIRTLQVRRALVTGQDTN